MANGDNLPYQDLDVIPFTPITSEWGDGIGDDILALAAGTGLDDGAVKPNKQATGIVNATNLAAGNKTATTYGTALSGTPGTNPSVTFDVPNSGQILVLLHARLQNDTSGSLTFMSFSLSGANTLAASDDNRIVYESTNNGDIAIFGGHVFLSGLNPGSTTAELEYRVTAGGGTIGDRRLTVIPIGN